MKNVIFDKFDISDIPNVITNKKEKDNETKDYKI